MGRLAPINLQKWIDEHRHLLKPPVGNKLVYEDSEFVIMVVGGPNSRTDYHDDPGEEFFYQIEGDIVLKVVEEGKLVDVPIREGEVFLLPAHVHHSPRRPASTVGLVIERKRGTDELDGFIWYCEHCGEELYSEYLHVSDIVSQLPPVFERFYGNEANCLCRKCGAKMTR
jgi:3-hydroxyanthranilate 3,4-dioxygenase